MTTTNNLIGYDPLAWLDGEDISEEAVAPEPEETPAPAKKATKSRAKTKKVEPVEEHAVVETAPEEVVEGEIVSENENDEIEVDVSVNEDGEISISIEASDDDKVRVEVTVEDNSEDETVESEHDVMEAIAGELESEEVKTSVEEEIVSEEVTQEAAILEEAQIEAAVEPHIDLEKDATIKNVAVLYSTVKNALAAHNAIEINAADVATIDTATLQLLVSLKKDAPNLGKTVEIIYPSERFVESAKLLGLTEILGI